MRSVFLSLLLLATTASTAQRPREAIVGLPCEGCAAVFDGIPTHLNSRARIAPESEPGAAMIVAGRVLDDRGQPQANVIVYSYQTNNKGIYPEPSVVAGYESGRHGTLRAWVKTDASGRYAFDTIRPGSYPTEQVPEHIHFHIIEPGCSTYYIDDVMFTDDPKLTSEQIRSLANNRGGNGVVTPTRKDGVWHVTRDIQLGLNIPEYQACRP